MQVLHTTKRRQSLPPRWGDMSLGQRLLSARIMRGLAQVDLAAAANIGLRTLRYLESDSGHDCQFRTIARVCRVLQLSLDVLCKGLKGY
jgi:DNA-binding Xre family transcriptional regulator